MPQRPGPLVENRCAVPEFQLRSILIFRLEHKPDGLTSMMYRNQVEEHREWPSLTKRLTVSRGINHIGRRVE